MFFFETAFPFLGFRLGIHFVPLVFWSTPKNGKASTSQGILDSLRHGNSLGPLSDRAKQTAPAKFFERNLIDMANGILYQKKHEWIPGRILAFSDDNGRLFFFFVFGVSVLGPRANLEIQSSKKPIRKTSLAGWNMLDTLLMEFSQWKKQLERNSLVNAIWRKRNQNAWCSKKPL